MRVNMDYFAHFCYPRQHFLNCMRVMRPLYHEL